GLEHVTGNDAQEGHVRPGTGGHVPLGADHAGDLVALVPQRDFFQGLHHLADQAHRAGGVLAVELAGTDGSTQYPQVQHGPDQSEVDDGHHGDQWLGHDQYRQYGHE